MTEFSKEELKNSKRIYKSATPKYTIDSVSYTHLRAHETPEHRRVPLGR